MRLALEGTVLRQENTQTYLICGDINCILFHCWWYFKRELYRFPSHGRDVKREGLYLKKNDRFPSLGEVTRLKVQASSYKVSKSWECNGPHGDYN